MCLRTLGPSSVGGVSWRERKTDSDTDSSPDTSRVAPRVGSTVGFSLGLGGGGWAVLSDDSGPCRDPRSGDSKNSHKCRCKSIYKNDPDASIRWKRSKSRTPCPPRVDSGTDGPRPLGVATPAVPQPLNVERVRRGPVSTPTLRPPTDPWWDLGIRGGLAGLSLRSWSGRDTGGPTSMS